jgi:hypothetical protein
VYPEKEKELHRIPVTAGGGVAPEPDDLMMIRQFVVLSRVPVFG